MPTNPTPRSRRQLSAILIAVGTLVVVLTGARAQAQVTPAPTTSIAGATPATTTTVAAAGATPAADPTAGAAASTTVPSTQRTDETPADAGTYGEVPTTIDPNTLVFEPPTGFGTGQSSINVTIGDPTKPSQSVLIIVALTLLSLAPSLLILLTSFTRIAIVLSLVRNAIGVQSIPPNQVIVGLALFLSLFVMRPTFEKINNEAVQPLLRNEITQQQAYDRGIAPLRTFMLDQTGSHELKLMIAASDEPKPAKPDDISTATLIPAFILSEIRIAFLIGFVIFIPFLVIDMVVSSSLMSMGMMMLPPVVISMPFKLLLFVLVDGWALVVKSLIESFH